jgi:hypothetical protein
MGGPFKPHFGLSGGRIPRFDGVSLLPTFYVHPGIVTDGMQASAGVSCYLKTNGEPLTRFTFSLMVTST